MKALKLLLPLSIGVFMFIYPLSAKEPSISITSQVLKQSPKIIIRSRYDFEKQISLKVKPDPRFLPSDVFIRKISEIGLYDARGVRITSDFDVDMVNDLVLAFSGGSSQIIKSTVNPSGFTITANFKDKNGHFTSPPKDSIALYSTSGEKLCFEYKDIHIAAPKMAFILLLDRSGSMSEVIADVQKSAEDFLKELPKSAECSVASFNENFFYHHEYFQNCNCSDFRLGILTAGGGTRLYEPLIDAYQSLSREYFEEYQKAVIIITDGQISPDDEMKKALLSAKKGILTFVYFLGDKDDHHLIGLADSFLQATTDIKTSLEAYFHSLGIAYGSQKVLEVRRCDGSKP